MGARTTVPLNKPGRASIGMSTPHHNAWTIPLPMGTVLANADPSQPDPPLLTQFTAVRLITVRGAGDASSIPATDWTRSEKRISISSIGVRAAQTPIWKVKYSPRAASPSIAPPGPRFAQQYGMSEFMRIGRSRRSGKTRWGAPGRASRILWLSSAVAMISMGKKLFHSSMDSIRSTTACGRASSARPSGLSPSSPLARSQSRAWGVIRRIVFDRRVIRPTRRFVWHVISVIFPGTVPGLKTNSPNSRLTLRGRTSVTRRPAVASKNRTPMFSGAGSRRLQGMRTRTAPAARAHPYDGPVIAEAGFGRPISRSERHFLGRGERAEQDDGREPGHDLPVHVLSFRQRSVFGSFSR